MPFPHSAAKPSIPPSGFIAFICVYPEIVKLPKGVEEEEDDIILIISF